MISCYLFGFAVPLAVCASPVLRLAVWLYTCCFGAIPVPPRSIEPDPESEPVVASPARVPDYRISFALLLSVIFVTSFIAGFGSLVSMAVFEILSGKGIVPKSSLGTFSVGVEVLLLPVGLVMLAWLLQEWLPTRFSTACLISGLFLSLAIFCLLVATGAFWLLLALIQRAAPSLVPANPFDAVLVAIYGLVLLELVVGLLLLAVWLLLAPLRWAMTPTNKTATA